MEPHRSDSSEQAAAFCGLAAVSLQVAAVLVLRPLPHVYKPGYLVEWHAEIAGHALRTAAGGWTFTLGLVMLAVFALMLAEAVPAARPGWLRAGALFLASGALLDAAGALGPMACAFFLPPPTESTGEAARALLALALLLDTAYNVLLGAALLAMNLAAGAVWPRWLRALGVLAGATSLPLVFQAASTGRARTLSLGGPLWLVWVSIVSLRLLFAARARRGA